MGVVVCIAKPDPATSPPPSPPLPHSSDTLRPYLPQLLLQYHPDTCFSHSLIPLSPSILATLLLSHLPLHPYSYPPSPHPQNSPYMLSPCSRRGRGWCQFSNKAGLRFIWCVHVGCQLACFHLHSPLCQVRMTALMPASVIHDHHRIISSHVTQLRYPIQCPPSPSASSPPACYLTLARPLPFTHRPLPFTHLLYVFPARLPPHPCPPVALSPSSHCLTPAHPSPSPSPSP